MPDMIVKLYDLDDAEKYLIPVRAREIVIRRAIVAEKRVISRWVSDNFGPGWADECEVSFSRQPVSCFIAHKDDTIFGFATYDVAFKACFGPTGVSADSRGTGIGTALLFACLHAMYAEGYAYGIIGGAGPTEFYSKVVNAIEIPHSVPGMYKDMLKSLIPGVYQDMV